MKKPRMVDFLNGNDYGPLTVDEGKRYTRADKFTYLATRIAQSPIGERRKHPRRDQGANPLMCNNHGIPTVARPEEALAA